jgi:hypothetical protein
MKLPNWLLITWWGIALIGMLLFLFARLPTLEAGGATFADIVVFLILVGLWVLPLVSEVDILGVKLKREVQAVKDELKGEIRELRNSVEVRNTVSAQVYAGYPPPPPDQSLPELKVEIHKAVSEAMAETQFGRPTIRSAEIEVPGDAEYLFQVRYSLEKELRRIYTSRINDPKERFTSVIAMARMLVRSEDLTPQLAGAIREVYSACSAAVHGEDVSDKQVAFVKDVAPELVSVLRGIR